MNKREFLIASAASYAVASTANAEKLVDTEDAYDDISELLNPPDYSIEKLVKLEKIYKDHKKWTKFEYQGTQFTALIYDLMYFANRRQGFLVWRKFDQDIFRLRLRIELSNSQELDLRLDPHTDSMKLFSEGGSPFEKELFSTKLSLLCG